MLAEHKLPILPQLHAESLKSTGCQPGGLVQVCLVVLGVQGWDSKTRRRCFATRSSSIPPRRHRAIRSSRRSVRTKSSRSRGSTPRLKERSVGHFCTITR